MQSHALLNSTEFATKSIGDARSRSLAARGTQGGQYVHCTVTQTIFIRHPTRRRFRERMPPARSSHPDWALTSVDSAFCASCASAVWRSTWLCLPDAGKRAIIAFDAALHYRQGRF
jgi:hypothetical protein